MFETLVAIAILALIVYVHEIGHHAAARQLSIEVVELSLGFGKKLCQWTSPKSGTAYTLRLLPFGGYNSFLSEADLVGKHAAPSSAFNVLPVWKRFVTIAAGPAANMLLALILSSGLWVTDQISASLTAFADVSEGATAESTESMFILSMQTFGEMMQVVVTSPSRAAEVIGGPIGAVWALRDVVSKQGICGMVNVLILSSVSVGLFNLLPLPGLDGCKLLTLLVEKIRGKKLSERVDNVYEWVCLVSISILFCVMVYNDVSMLVQCFFG